MSTKKMTHPDASRTVEVPTGEVPIYESQGWTVKEPAAKKAAKKPAAPQPPVTT